MPPTKFSDTLHAFQAMKSAIERRNAGELIVQCGRLRECARRASAFLYLDIANGIEAHYARGDHRRAIALLADAIGAA